MATLYKVDGTSTEVTPKNGRDFKLEELYTLVGCEMVEAVHLDDGRVLWIDEEGKYSGPDGNAKPRNEQATELMTGQLWPSDFIAGDALLTADHEVL